MGSRDGLVDPFQREIQEPACADPIWSPTTDDELMNETLAIAERHNVVGVVSGPAVRVWLRG